jgi:hypothetical protein
MKKRIIFGIFINYAFFNLNAQEPLKHEPKIYVSPDQKVYVNKVQPVYFRVSVSPDPNAPSYVLPSEATTKYANPMYFDTEGHNTLRSPSAVDKVTKKQIMPKMDVLFDIYADGTAPQTSIKLSNSKQFTAKKTYYGNGLKVELRATDATSGTETTYISVNGEPYTDFSTFNQSMNNEKEYILKYYSVDRVGNAETPKQQKFQVDLTAPHTTYKILGESKGKVLSSKASIGLFSSDTLSGVDKIWYSINDGPYTAYSTPIPIQVLKNKNSKITYYATDKVGNKEESKVIATFAGSMADENSTPSYSFYIDKEPPLLGFEIEGDQYKGKYLFISERSKFKVIAKDDKSGVDKITYSVDNLTLKNEYTEPFSFHPAGFHSVAYAANDYVGNAALVKTQLIFMDNSIPTSSVAYLGNIFTNRDTIFITQNTKIQIKTSDEGSGIKETNYNFDQGEQLVYSSALKIETEGFHTLKYRSTDNVNNTEEWKTARFFIDNSAPQIFINYSTKAIGEKTVRDEKYTIYPSNVMLYIAATDNASGCEKIEYRINGNKLWQNLIPIKGFAPGNYEIEIIATDILKNKSTSVVRFAIEN